MDELSLVDQLKIVAGNPSEEELAAVIAILQADFEQQAQKTKKQQVAKLSWHRNPGQLRRELHPGPNAWQNALRSGLN